MGQNDRRIHRVNVNFSEQAWGVLQDLARRKETTISEVIRDSIGLAKWWQDTLDAGGRILIERDGRVREVEWV